MLDIKGKAIEIFEFEEIDVFVYYDQPLLFSCRDKKGQMYMAVACDETEKDEKWLYVPITPETNKLAKEEKISFHDIFTKPEQDLIYLLIVPYDDSVEISIEEKKVSEIPEEYFPLPEKKLVKY